MKLRHFLAAMLISLLGVVNVFSEGTPWYTDVEIDHVYRDAIWFMTQRDYVNGYEDGTFRAMDEVNRVEALKMIISSVDEFPEDIPVVEFSFPDVEPEAWYFKYLTDALSIGIVSGDDEGKFHPADAVNRVEALKMLLLAQGALLNETEGNEWYQKYLDYGIENALIVPVSYGNYQPDALLSRGELSDIIYRFIKDPYTGEVELGTATYYAGRFDGNGTANGETFSNDLLTAAHPTLPFDTMVRVTNLKTDLTVDVRINDRGPYAGGHIIDLSQSAFDTIGALSTGILSVQVETLK